MLRMSLNSLKAISADCFSLNQLRLIKTQCFLFNANIQARFLHSTQMQLKKQGQFIEPAVNDDNVKKNVATPFKVKLYPGFQESAEELNQIENESNEISAKKVIEDFYGLNELEFEKIDQEEFNETELHTLDENSKFDIDYVVKLLKNENVQDLCCIKIPAEINYADYMVIGTCLSDKHLNATFISINRKFKSKKSERNQYLQKKSGKEEKWCALDMGNVVVHLFLEEHREYYDLETLWSCGIEFDEKYIEFTKKQSDIEKRLIVPDEELNEKNT